MRLISEDLREHFAADILLARFRVGQNAARRRDDRDAEAVADNRQFLRTRIDTAARLRDARDMLDRGLALEIFQLDADAGRGAHLLAGIATDIALALENIENPRTQLRRRSEDGVLPGA